MCYERLALRAAASELVALASFRCGAARDPQQRSTPRQASKRTSSILAKEARGSPKIRIADTSFNGAQPGDPVRAAAVIIRLAALDEPPLRLLLGSDAVRIAEEYDLARLEADKKWRDLSMSTDFGPGRE